MKKFIGTKIVRAIPLNRADYNTLRGWELPGDEDGSDVGYLIEYLDGGEPNLNGYDGYVSWSPKEQFDNAYREVSDLNFGLALEALKKGLKVSRRGWNGKNMWLVLSEGSNGMVISISMSVSHQHSYPTWKENSSYANAGVSNVCIDPHIDMFTAKGTMQPGWLASQADMLADDWIILDA